MEKYNKIIQFIDENIFYCLFPLILTIILIELFCRNRFQTKQVLNLIRLFIISYTFVTLINYSIELLLFPNEFNFTSRATGPYWWAYWLMLFSATAFPLSLFYKKLAEKPFYLLFVAIFMKLGFYFERFVIIMTNYDRDYYPEKESNNWIFSFLLIFVQGFIIGIILLAFFEIIKQKNLNNEKI